MDDRFIAAAAGLSLLFWILAKERRIDPAFRRWLQPLAYLTLGAAVLYAITQALRWFAGAS